MLGEQYQAGLLVAALFANALLTYYVYHTVRRELQNEGAVHDAAGDAASETDLVDRDKGVVECTDCGATNDSGYRFCRECLAELPDAMDFGGGPSGPFGRST